MNEENQDQTNEFQSINQSGATEWQVSPPEQILKIEEPPQMSEVGTLGGIFFEPGKTFEDLRRKPRFILATVIIIILMTVFQFLFVQKLGEDRMKSFTLEQMEKSSQVQSLPPEQKQNALATNLKIAGFIRYLLPIFILIGMAIGGLIYWLGGKVMGGSGNFRHALSTWVYSSFPPIVIAMLANFLILFLKSADEIDIGASQRGLIHANPSFFIDGTSMPVLTTLIGTLDFFQIWGWILAAIGLQKLMKLSKGSAWGIVLILALVSLAFRVIGALFTGNPM